MAWLYHENMAGNGDWSFAKEYLNGEADVKEVVRVYVSMIKNNMGRGNVDIHMCLAKAADNLEEAAKLWEQGDSDDEDKESSKEEDNESSDEGKGEEEKVQAQNEGDYEEAVYLSLIHI